MLFMALCLSLLFELFFFVQFHGLSFVVQVTETRTGPLGCSNYDNLDSVSSVLVQSPENKVHLQGNNIFSLMLFVVLLSECHAQGS